LFSDSPYLDAFFSSYAVHPEEDVFLDGRVEYTRPLFWVESFYDPFEPIFSTVWFLLRVSVGALRGQFLGSLKPLGFEVSSVIVMALSGRIPCTPFWLALTGPRRFLFQ